MTSAAEKQKELQQIAANIRIAEEKAEDIKTNYNKKIEELVKKGNEKSIELREYYEKKAIETKNKVLLFEREKTEELVKKIIADGKQDAAKIRTKKLNEKELEDIFRNFLSSLKEQ